MCIGAPSINISIQECNLPILECNLVVDFRSGVYIVQCDKDGFEEASFEAMKLLPVDYPKSKVLEETPEKTGGGIEQINKHKHKHNNWI